MSEMNAPFINFSDAGVNVYPSVQEMCSHIENWTVKESPQWCHGGYDADGTPFKLVPGDRIPKVEPDAAACLDTNSDQRESMIEFLIREAPAIEVSEFVRITNREVFKRVVAVATRQIESSPPPPERSIDLAISRAFDWFRRLFK